MKGALHTALLEEINEALKAQHGDAFHEEGDGELVIPSGCTPQSAYVKVDTSWLADAALRPALEAHDRLVRALKAMLDETDPAKVTPMPTGLGLARYQALEAVELATGPFKKVGDLAAGIVAGLSEGRK